MRWLHTSDIHGSVMNINIKRELDVDILSDGGDNLQGSPWVDYAGAQVIAEKMNESGYDIGVVGNHDIEAGLNQMREWVNGCAFPVLAANIKVNGVKPYIVIEREGIRIAVLGLVTSAISQWISEDLWRGVSVEEIASCAKKWVAIIKEQEQADLVVGIFHSGWEGGIRGENETRFIAEVVCGFDIIFYGHDHHSAIHWVNNKEDKKVLCIAPGSHCTMAAIVDIQKRDNCDDAANAFELTPQLIEYPTAKFQEWDSDYQCWLNTPICKLAQDIDERDSFFGPSSFINLFHQMQLYFTNAEISFASPVNYDSLLTAGYLTMQDVYTLYRYNTQLYTMMLTGREILGILEKSYSLWCNRMNTPDDDALLMDYILDDGKRKGLKNISLNMLSAEGIEYEVNLMNGADSPVKILRMSDGTPFLLDKTYKVAINSYHGSGGGGLLTDGAGIMHEELRSRIAAVNASSSRQCLINFLKSYEEYTPYSKKNWRFIPVEWADKALQRDRETLFTIHC